MPEGLPSVGDAGRGQTMRLTGVEGGNLSLRLCHGGRGQRAAGSTKGWAAERRTGLDEGIRVLSRERESERDKERERRREQERASGMCGEASVEQEVKERALGALGSWHGPSPNKRCGRVTKQRERDNCAQNAEREERAAARPLFLLFRPWASLAQVHGGALLSTSGLLSWAHARDLWTYIHRLLGLGALGPWGPGAALEPLGLCTADLLAHPRHSCSFIISGRATPPSTPFPACGSRSPPWCHALPFAHPSRSPFNQSGVSHRLAPNPAAAVHLLRPARPLGCAVAPPKPCAEAMQPPSLPPSICTSYPNLPRTSLRLSPSGSPSTAAPRPTSDVAVRVHSAHTVAIAYALHHAMPNHGRQLFQPVVLNVPRPSDSIRVQLPCAAPLAICLSVVAPPSAVVHPGASGTRRSPVLSLEGPREAALSCLTRIGRPSGLVCAERQDACITAVANLHHFTCSNIGPCSKLLRQN